MTHGEKPKQPIEQGKPLIKTIASGILQIRMAQNRPKIWTLLTVGKYPTPNSNSELVDKNPETTDENMEQSNDEKTTDEIFIAQSQEEIKAKLTELEQWKSRPVTKACPYGSWFLIGTELTALLAQEKAQKQCLHLVHQESDESTLWAFKQPSSKVRIWNTQYFWEHLKKPKSKKSGSYKNACNELANASRYWYLDIPAELCKLGGIPSKLDQGIFYFYNRREIISTVSLSVHDLLLAGNLGLAQIIQKL